MNLPKDVQRKIALNLEAHELIKFCSTNQKTYQDICNSDEFWRLKLEMDYPNEFKNAGIIKNPKNIYIKKFQYISNMKKDLNFTEDNMRDIYDEKISDFYPPEYLFNNDNVITLLNNFLNEPTISQLNKK